MIGIAFSWLALAIIVGVAANTRGRSGVGWFLLAAVISPLIAGLLVLALPRFDNPYDGGLLVIERERAIAGRHKRMYVTWTVLAVLFVTVMIVAAMTNHN